LGILPSVRIYIVAEIDTVLCVCAICGASLARWRTRARPVAALGGWWPSEITPDWMQLLQKVLPSGWAMGAMHRLISFGPAAYEKVHFELNAKRMRIEIEAK
jgi:hypothetical protein